MKIKDIKKLIDIMLEDRQRQYKCARSDTAKLFTEGQIIILKELKDSIKGEKRK